MKWPAKVTRKPPEDGDVRLFRKFAYLPFYIDGVIVWLEYYETLQVYKTKKEVVKIDNELIEFLAGQWVNLADRCK